MLLSRDQILTPKLVIEKFPSEQLEGEVFVRRLSSREMLLHIHDVATTCEVAEKKKQTVLDLRERFIVKCLCDEQGEPILTKADLEALTNQSPKVVDELYQICQKLNPFSEKDKVETDAKNSEEAPSDSSSD